MGTIVSVLLGGTAALLFWRARLPLGMWAAIAATVAAFWSAGVMHNYATQRAFARHQRLRQVRVNQGASPAELSEFDNTPVHPTPEDVQQVPDGITKVNMAANLAVLALLVWSLIRTFS